MIIYSSCFPNIDNALRISKMTRKDLSEKSGIKLQTLGCKLRLESDFTRSEMFKIKSIFDAKGVPTISLEQLFTTSSNSRTA
jgi:hypothetical protein